MIVGCGRFPDYCETKIHVDNDGEFGTLVDDTFPLGGGYCQSCSSYHCPLHMSLTYRHTCTDCVALGHGKESDRVADVA